MTEQPSWETFRRRHDLLDLSHRGLQRLLIPSWLSQPRSLSQRIEASAYGETPAAVITQVLDWLEVSSGEVFLDLGCGGGNVLAPASSRGARVLGLEQNPELCRAAQSFLSASQAEVRCEDFLHADWSLSDGTPATVVYCTTARLPQSVLAMMAQRLMERPTLRAAACLGRPLPLEEPDWQTDSEAYQIRWNAGEPALGETLYLYRRSVLGG